MDGDPTARRILAAGRRVLGREGADAVTMRRVAGAVGITPMAIYRHFAGRDGLLNALADEGFAELAGRLRRAQLSGGVEQRITTLGEIYLEHALDRPRMFELMFLKARAGARHFPRDFKARRSPTANVMAEVIEEGMKRGHFRKDDAWEIVFELGALSHGLIVLYLGGRLEVSRGRFRELYRRSFRRYIRGIRK
jgi:AcrR family transcriptional regulator